MIDTSRILEWLTRGSRVALVAASAAVLTTSATLAQQPQQPPKKEAPAKKAPPPAAAKKEQPKQAEGGQPQNYWVKLCDKTPFMVPDKEGKPTREARTICLTHHERIDGNTGNVLVSAALRHVEGEEKQHLMFIVPLGAALEPGLRAKIYNAEQWDKIQKNEKFDDTKIEAIKFTFTFCHQAGCTAEIEASKELIDGFKTGAGIVVFVFNAQRQLIPLLVPLAGFNEALAGAPTDSEKYSEARKAMMQQIAERQQQMVEEYRKRQAEAAAQKGGAPTPGAAAPAAKAPAPPPAEKKK